MEDYKLSACSITNIPSLTDSVESAGLWERRQEHVRRAWRELLGTPPASYLPARPGDEISFEVVEETAESDHRRLDIRYRTNHGETLYAYLLVPLQEPPLRGGKYPAVLALHPTTAEGRADVATPQGRENRRYGLELASRGYVVLAPDSIAFGNRIYPGTEPFQTAPFYERYPGWTAVGKMLDDHIAALNLLAALPEVDEGRMGAIGHSLGGYNAWFLAGMDRRIKAAASSCGFSMFTDDPDPYRWGQREWFSHFPALTELLKADRIPFEWHEIAALALPTPMFMWSGISDRIFSNWAAIASGMTELERLYRKDASPEAFEFWMGPSGHDFPPRARKLAYEFLDRWLKSS
ncbi:alpha/beta hydrolase family protein [Paenibacillus allorhizosphaerae]|uniref:Dienelactone hydrolase domain-containing protein n=1 Tax=Paenibacillus allorhizosphaerae TaxID=2849866 RepID=A0ABN7TUD1_9BACL|nr:dienelactone hydrolase family protein [Paenibacillus allorhizosphaerae]CAG7652509.1 hypothetical protein PAECIP111802_05239 [Paenibacillus allorhizosphaerae]